MTRRYVEIHYTDSVERVPLADVGELRQILADRGSYVSYAVRSSWRYGLVPHGKGKTTYEPHVTQRLDQRH
jgi:hypothetical protein